MRDKDNKWRIGKCKIFSSNHHAFALRNRLRNENFQDVWILDVFDNNKDAWVCEQTNSIIYRIPQFITQYHKVSYDKKDIDKIYDKLGDINESVKKCLSEYGRDINYPFVSMFDNKHISREHLFEIRACNILPKIMDVGVFYEENKTSKSTYTKIEYERIENLEIIEGEFDVYGLKVEMFESYVGDKILTHNSIYSFSGANVNIMLDIYKDTDFKIYMLTKNFRNPKQILNTGRKIIEQLDDFIEKDNLCMNGEYGKVSTSSMNNLLGYVKPGMIILTRTNKEVEKINNILSSNGIDVICLQKSGKTQKELNEIFKSEKVKVMTIHQSKGLEFDRVVVYGKNMKINRRTVWKDSDEEKKIMYVAITRAKNELVILN